MHEPLVKRGTTLGRSDTKPSLRRVSRVLPAHRRCLKAQLLHTMECGARASVSIPTTKEFVVYSLLKQQEFDSYLVFRFEP